MGYVSALFACAPLVAHGTAMAVVQVESGGNPYAIGVVGGRLERQPRTRIEAVVTTRALEAQGWNYSVGLGQINRSNFARLGLTAETAFEPCENLRAMQTILGECFERAARRSEQQAALRQALSCYYSGNFSTGFLDGYVARVVHAAQALHAKQPHQEGPTAGKANTTQTP